MKTWGEISGSFERVPHQKTSHYLVCFQQEDSLHRKHITVLEIRTHTHSILHLNLQCRQRKQFKQYGLGRGVVTMYAHTPVRTLQSTKNVSIASSFVGRGDDQCIHSFMCVPPGKMLATPLLGGKLGERNKTNDHY